MNKYLPGILMFIGWPVLIIGLLGCIAVIIHLIADHRWVVPADWVALVIFIGVAAAGGGLIYWAVMI